MVTGGWWALEVAAQLQWLPTTAATAARPVLAVLTLPLAALAATYTAFLFAQAEGRDLWQAPHLPVLMATQAVAIGAGASAALAAGVDLPEAWTSPLRLLFGGGSVASLAITLVGDLGITPPSEVARRGLHTLMWGPFRARYWSGLALAYGAPVALIGVGHPVADVAAAALAAVGLFLWAYALVMAPQTLQNS